MVCISNIISFAKNKVMENKVKYYRNKRKLTQVQLANASGLTQGRIAQLESDGGENVLKSYKSIAKVLGVDWKKLI